MITDKYTTNALFNMLLLECIWAGEMLLGKEVTRFLAVMSIIEGCVLHERLCPFFQAKYSYDMGDEDVGAFLTICWVCSCMGGYNEMFGKKY